MAPTYSTKLGLWLPDGDDDLELPPLIFNFNKIDDAAGHIKICTSSSRPSAPYAEQVIYETDTRDMYYRNVANNAWVLLDNIPTFATTGDVPSPYTNQVVFITTGATFYRYTGGAWVLYNMFGHMNSATVLTQNDCTSTSYAALGSGPAVSITSVGTKAWVQIQATMFGSDATFRGIAASFAISGATTKASSDADGALCTANNAGYGFRGIGWAEVAINPGANTYTMQYKTSAGTSPIKDRKIWVYAP